MRGRRGAALLQIQTEGEGHSLSAVEDMAIESNHSFGKGRKEDSKITEM